MCINYLACISERQQYEKGEAAGQKWHLQIGEKIVVRVLQAWKRHAFMRAS